MSVQLYWKERLQAQNPLFKETLRVSGVTIRPHAGIDPKAQWPRAVNRHTLYVDYINWHEEVYLAGFRDSEYFKDPERLPKPAEELVFFNTMYPWLYLVGKKQQVRTYLVDHEFLYEGQWHTGKKHTYFVRLCAWEHHVALYELLTGHSIGLESPYYDEDRARVVADARSAYLEQIAQNRVLYNGNFEVGETADEDHLTDA